MSEIETGEYIRLDDGTIGKFLYNNGSNFVYEVNEEQIEESSGIINHSKNIIDLIEVGDYVNGDEVEDIYFINNTKVLSLNGDFTNSKCFEEKDIKWIVTKEIFKRESYKVGG